MNGKSSLFFNHWRLMDTVRGGIDGRRGPGENSRRGARGGRKGGRARVPPNEDVFPKLPRFDRGGSGGASGETRGSSRVFLRVGSNGAGENKTRLKRTEMAMIVCRAYPVQSERGERERFRVFRFARVPFAGEGKFRQTTDRSWPPRCLPRNKGNERGKKARKRAARRRYCRVFILRRSCESAQLKASEIQIERVRLLLFSIFAKRTLL